MMTDIAASSSTSHPFLLPLSRRRFLGGLTAVVIAAAVTERGIQPAFAESAGTVLPLVSPLAAGKPVRALFAPEEQVFAAYLMILAPLANSVVDDDPARYGWMEDGWQRTPNQPFNARIMEHVATLSWFYANERPWNPYYLDPNLLGRLNAALGFYLGLQNADGSFSENGAGGHELSPTGFGTVALSATLRDLRDTNALPQRQSEIEAALRLGCGWLVDLSKPQWITPVAVVNQVVAGLAGVAQTSEVLGDPAIAAALADRLSFLLEHGQAEGGFFNEPRSYDAGYNFDVMLPDLGHIYLVTDDLNVREMVSRWADFFGHVVIMEPGQTFGFHFASASSRNGTSEFFPRPEDDLDRGALGRAFLEDVPKLGAFYAPSGDKQAWRTSWAASTAPVQPRRKLDSSPRLYMHVPPAPDGVTAAERDAQIAALPYLVSDNFTKTFGSSIIREGRPAQHFNLVRRPGYYLGSVYGLRPYPLQRTGPGFFWNPVAGMVVLGMNSIAEDQWGTIAAGGTESARSDAFAIYYNGPDSTSPVVDWQDAAQLTGLFSTRYATANGVITTDVQHWHDGVVRTSTLAENAREQIPMVVGPDDVLEFFDGTPVAYGVAAVATTTGFALTRNGIRTHFYWGQPLAATWTPMDRFYLDDTRQYHVLNVLHSGAFSLQLTSIDVTEVVGRVKSSATGHRWGKGRGQQQSVHVVNLENEPVDMRIVVAGAGRPQEFKSVAPGASVYARTNSQVPVRNAMVILNTQGRNKRFGTARITL